MTWRGRWAPLAVVTALQAGDLATTWVGLRLPGLHEAGGCPFWVLVAGKAALVAGCWLLARDPRNPRSRRAAWVAAGILAVLYAPIIAHNLLLIRQALSA